STPSSCAVCWCPASCTTWAGAPGGPGRGGSPPTGRPAHGAGCASALSRSLRGEGLARSDRSRAGGVGGVGEDGAMFSIATVNVNGIRAAFRRGMDAWITEQAPDVILLQEVRANDDILTGFFGDGWHLVHEEGAAKGRAGVAIASRVPMQAV